MFEFKESPRDIRLRLGLNQLEFWGRVGVTQSGGSRYESGRGMTKPVRELLRLVYVEGVDLSKVHRADIAIIQYLKAEQPALYRSLKASAKAYRVQR